MEVSVFVISTLACLYCCRNLLCFQCGHTIDCRSVCLDHTHWHIIYIYIYIYISIYYIARKRRHLGQSTIRQEVHVAEAKQLEPEMSERERPEHSNKAVSFLHDLMLAKMYFIVVACNVLLNLPNAIVLAAYTERVKTLDGIVQIKIWTLTLVAMNSTANCIIFFWANKNLRSEGWKICKQFLNL